MRFVRPFFALCLVLGLVPGGVEMFEDAGHLLFVGHLEEGACADACDDSGCTPGSHACPCCPSLRVTAAEQRLTVPGAEPSGELELTAVANVIRPGFARRVPRPPAA